MSVWVFTIGHWPSVPNHTPRVLYTSIWLTAGSHTVIIEATGLANATSGNTFIAVDAFDVTP